MIAHDISSNSTKPAAPQIPNTAPFSPTFLDRLPGPLLAGVTAAIYLVVAAICLKLLVKPESVTPIWPVNAIVMAILARLKRSRWHWVLFGQALACFEANLAAAIPIATICCYIAGNLLETLLAVTILTRFGTEKIDFSSIGHLVRLLLAAGSASAMAGAFVAATHVYLTKSPGFLNVWRLWAAADSLGMLVVVPILLGFRRPAPVRTFTHFNLESLILVVVFALVSYCEFWVQMPPGIYIFNRPLLITVPFLIWAALRTNVFVTSLITLIFCGFAVVSTLSGHGPYPDFESTIEKTIVVLQISLMVWTICGIVISIVTTENRQNLQMVSRERERFRRLTDSIGEVFWMAGPDIEQMIYISPAYEKIWGRSCQSLIADPKSFIEAIHPDDRERVIQDIPGSGTRPFSHEYRVVRPDGSIRWIFDRGLPVTDENGLKYRTGVAQDITDRKNFEQALIEANEFNNQIISNVQDGIIVVDLQMRYRVWSPAMERLSGMPAATVLGKTPLELFPFLRDVGVIAMLERAMAGETVSSPDFPFVVPETGRQGWNWQLMGPLRSADGQIIGVITTVRDITQRKEAQDARALFRTLIDHSNDGIIVVAPDSGRFLDVNEKFCAQTGYTREQLLSMNVADINPTLDRNSFADVSRKLMETGTMILETIHRRQDGATIPVEVSSKRVQLDREYFVTVVRDIADRRRSEELLRQSHERFQVLADATFEGILMSENGVIIDCNEQFARMNGYARGELIGTRTELLLPPEDRERIFANVKAGRDLNVEQNGLRKDGSRIFTEARGRSISYSGRQVRITVVRDITHRVRMEELALQSEKMLSIGALAAGMAHEINNPLAIMMHNAQIVAQRLSADSPQNQAAAERAGTTLQAIAAYMKDREIVELLAGIHGSGARAASIVQNMLAFSRPRSTKMAMHHLDHLIDQAVDLIQSDCELKKRYDIAQIEIVKEFDRDLPPVACHDVEMQQVLLNLFKNAVQATVPDSTAAGSPPSPRIVVRTRRENGHARIEVEDNGAGIPESLRRRVFEPFFTTKSPGEGAGLGLFISYFIISQNHKGAMSVTANPTGGPRFEITLPLE